MKEHQQSCENLFLPLLRPASSASATEAPDSSNNGRRGKDGKTSRASDTSLWPAVTEEMSARRRVSLAHSWRRAWATSPPTPPTPPPVSLSPVLTRGCNCRRGGATSALAEVKVDPGIQIKTTTCFQTSCELQTESWAVSQL